MLLPHVAAGILIIVFWQIEAEFLFEVVFFVFAVGVVERSELAGHVLPNPDHNGHGDYHEPPFVVCHGYECSGMPNVEHGKPVHTQRNFFPLLLAVEVVAEVDSRRAQRRIKVNSFVDANNVTVRQQVKADEQRQEKKRAGVSSDQQRADGQIQHRVHDADKPDLQLLCIAPSGNALPPRIHGVSTRVGYCFYTINIVH